MKIKIFYIIAGLFLFMLTTPVFAQEGITDPGDDPGLPIDGGISLLIAGGTALGVYALKKKK